MNIYQIFLFWAMVVFVSALPLLVGALMIWRAIYGLRGREYVLLLIGICLAHFSISFLASLLAKVAG